MHYHLAKACDDLLLDIEPIYIVCLELSEVGVSVVFLPELFLAGFLPLIF